MARPRDEDVRGPILMATFSCVGRKGVSGLSVREVARLTGLSTGSVTHHFPTRRELLDSAIDFGFRRLGPKFAPTPDTTLGWLLERYDLSDEGRYSWWRFVFALVCEAGSTPEIAERLEAERHVVVQRWLTALEHEQECGRVREGADLMAEARRLAALGNGFVLAQLITPTNTAHAVTDLRRAVDALAPEHATAR
jgi:AcrR family transcriptional regulator